MATRTVANGGGNFNATGTWVEGAVPTAADAVVFTATSGQLTVNVASACLSIDFTNYTNTITFNNTLTVSGNVTLAAGFTQAGASGIIINANATLTSNGVTWSRTFVTAPGAGATITLTLSGNWTQSNTTTFNSGGSATTVTTINNNSFIFSGTYTLTNSAGTVNGTSTLLFSTGTVTITGTNNIWQNNLTINTTGGVIFTAAVNIYYNTGTFTYTGGTVTTTNNTLTVGSPGTTTTLNTGLLVWGNVTWGVNNSANMNIVLNSNFLWAGLFNLAGRTTLTGTGLITPSGSSNSLTFGFVGISYNYTAFFPNPLNVTNLNTQCATANTVTFTNPINVSGNLTITNGNLIGSTITMTGTGSLSGNSTQGTLQSNLTFNTSGTITFLSPALQYNTGTITYTSANYSFSTSFLLNITGSMTFNTSTLPWNSIQVLATPTSNITITLNSLLTAKLFTNLLVNFSVAFAGSYGFSIETLAHSGKLITFGSGLTYTIRSSFPNFVGLNQDSTYRFNASTPGSPAYLTLNWGASCVVACLSFVDIDASGGRPIYVFTPIAISGSGINTLILSNTKNIFKITDLLTVGS